MSNKAKNVTVNNDLMLPSMGEFNSITFNTDAILSQYQHVEKDSQGNEVITYSMSVNGVGEHAGETFDINDRHAIEAIVGLRNTQALDKWLSYRQGAYLMQLVDSPFMKNNEIKSVAKLADTIDLGVETSTSNALESVSRKLGVNFDSNGNLHLADGLPLLSFWTYSNIISLVVETDDGYDRSHLIDFIKKCNVTPLMSQKKVKELFKDYKDGKIGESMTLPDKMAEKIKKEREAKEKQSAEKEKAKQIAESASAYVTNRMATAENFMEKQAIILDLIDSLWQSIDSISEEKASEVETTFDNLKEWACNLKEVTE